MSTSLYELRARLVTAFILSAASIALAQSPENVEDAIYSKGFHAERNYFSPEPWESFDTVNGNVLLTYTDLVLPGNAGRELRFQRVYNNQRPDHLLNPVPQHVSRWSFGFPGMVMYIEDSGG